jgi:hypothetical protein
MTSTASLEPPVPSDFDMALGTIREIKSTVEAADAKINDDMTGDEARKVLEGLMDEIRHIIDCSDVAVYI